MSLVVKVLWKFVSLIYFRVYLEVNVHKNPTCFSRWSVRRYTLAVDRKIRRDSEPAADFIPCVVFGRSAEFAEQYFRQGMRISISGRIQTGSYTNKNGVKVYTTEVVVEEQEFAESRGEHSTYSSAQKDTTAHAGDGFMDIPNGIDEELPFN